MGAGFQQIEDISIGVANSFTLVYAVMPFEDGISAVLKINLQRTNCEEWFPSAQCRRMPDKCIGNHAFRMNADVAV